MSGEIYRGGIAQDHLPEIEMIPGVGIRTLTKHIRKRNDAVALASQYFAAGVRASVQQEGDSPIWRVGQDTNTPSLPTAPPARMPAKLPSPS